MHISKTEVQAMTIAEKNELLDMLWESLEQENCVDSSDAIRWNNLRDDLINY